MANEVKRWKATMLRDDGHFQEVEVVEAVSHDRIIAEQKLMLKRARELYNNAVRLADKYSREKYPDNQTVTLEEVMGLYDNSLKEARVLRDSPEEREDT